MSENKKRVYKDLDLDGPSNLEFTQAMEVLSDEDRDIFENTGVIHIDRDMPAETQAMHVVHLTKKHEKRRNRVYVFIQVLLIAGIVLTGLGIILQRIIRNTSTAVQQNTIEEGVSKNASLVEITNEVFPDDYFRTYIIDTYDLDHDGYLSSDERNSVLLLITPEDQSIATLEGISLFPLLQSLTLQNTNVSQLNVSSNEKLEFLNVNNTPLTSLDVSSNEALTTIYMNQTAITEIILSENSNVREIAMQDVSLTCTKNEDGIYVSCE